MVPTSTLGSTRNNGAAPPETPNASAADDVASAATMGEVSGAVRPLIVVTATVADTLMVGATNCSEAPFRTQKESTVSAPPPSNVVTVASRVPEALDHDAAEVSKAPLPEDAKSGAESVCVPVKPAMVMTELAMTSVLGRMVTETRLDMLRRGLPWPTVTARLGTTTRRGVDPDATPSKSAVATSIATLATGVVLSLHQLKVYW
mmetsp:Transcript_5980/g.15328  ORF Transcript_5980/g.15328 Transcript_5980/m.15328 type:complete len:204 (-) Transcript_5980:434-1045(-)